MAEGSKGAFASPSDRLCYEHYMTSRGNRSSIEKSDRALVDMAGIPRVLPMIDHHDPRLRRRCFVVADRFGVFGMISHMVLMLFHGHTQENRKVSPGGYELRRAKVSCVVHVWCMCSIDV